MELEILILTDEIAVALAGFSAIVSNFSRDWTVEKSSQLANLLIHSGIALFASMVPLIMSQRPSADLTSEGTLWSISSAAYIFFATSYLVVSLFRSRKVVQKNQGLDRIFIATFIIAVVAQLYNLWAGAEAWIYLLALLVNVAYAFVSFTMLIKPLVQNKAGSNL